jgi:hypothetical protein
VEAPVLDVLLANPTHCFGDVELQALSAIRWQMHLLAVRGAPGGRVAAARLEYRGHFIDVQSHESDGKQWRPKAVVSIYHGGVLHQKTVAAPIEVLFDSETAADTYSLGMAKKWIDDNS